MTDQPLAALVGAGGLSLYFVCFGLAFIARPSMVEGLGLQPTNPSGVTEVRAYYGAFSIASGIFAAYLVASGLARYAVVGGFIFATCVLGSRVLFSFVDGAMKEKYTRFAFFWESLFVVALAICVWTSR